MSLLDDFTYLNRFIPKYPDDTDYNTNSPSFYEYLAKQNKIMKILIQKIYDYDKELAKRFEEWDKNLQDFPDDVKALLEKWLNDGTLDHIINDTIFNWKADKTYVDYEIERLELKDENLTTQLADNKILTINTMGLSNETSINKINKTTFSNVVLNFENKELTLDNNLKLNLYNCEVINLNLKTLGYNSLRFEGNNYSLKNSVLDGINANQDYVNKTDSSANLFIALEVIGNNVKVNNNIIQNYVSRQALLVSKSDMFEVMNNKIYDCYSYNRVKAEGTFDNYGDGIHITYSKNGKVLNNEVINSAENPIGRCGIVIEFDCNNVNAERNKVAGYDRGIHLELVNDLITISKNHVVSCNVPMMIWNCNLATIDVSDNYFSDLGLNYVNPLHHTILEAVHKGLICVLGDYKTTLKNHSNVIFKRNMTVASPINRYKVFLYVENAFHVKFREKNQFINNSLSEMSLKFGSDDFQRFYYIDMEESVIEGQLDVVLQDFINLKNNKIEKIYFHTKPANNLQLVGLENRVIENNVIYTTQPTGGAAFSGNISFIFKDNTIFNMMGDYVFNNQSGIVEGNKFIRNSSKLGILDLTLVRNSGRYRPEASTKTLYGTKNNLFMDEISKLYFSLTPNGVLVD